MSTSGVSIHLGESPGESFIYDRLVEFWTIQEIGFWILGASYNDTLRIDANFDLRCGENSCYEQSLKRGKICKPGMLLHKIFQSNNKFRVYE